MNLKTSIMPQRSSLPASKDRRGNAPQDEDEWRAYTVRLSLLKQSAIAAIGVINMSYQSYLILAKLIIAIADSSLYSRFNRREYMEVNMINSLQSENGGNVLERSLRAEQARLVSEIEQLRQEIEEKRMACQAKENRLGHVEALLSKPPPSAPTPKDRRRQRDDSSTPTVQLLDMAEQVLRERLGDPMHYRDLADELMRQGAVIGGKDPAGSLVSRMTQDDKGKAEADKRFVRPTSRGFYALREDYPKARNVGARRRGKQKTG